VRGSPAAIFSVNPDYGVHLVASGNVVNLSAPAYSNVSPGLRLSIAGWTGSGSVPATGTSNAVDVVFETDSSIQWNWVNQYSLTQTSTVAGIINTTTWWNAWTSAVTVKAEAELEHNAVMYGFAGWRIDGARYPNNSAVALNPASGITMFGPRIATAVYLPAVEDSNTNSLPDWWEQFYFGTNTPSAGADADGDGFTNDAEYQDRTNPRDAASVPVAPVIGHTALSDPQTSPAPWTVSASVTDNAAVNNSFLYWQKNGGVWTSTMMSAQSATSFVANLPAPGTNGDQFVYRIEATDYAGLTATNGPYMFNVAYPRMRASPASFGIVNVPALTASNVFVHITNAGSGSLVWTLDQALFYEHVEMGTNGWTHAGANDVWHLDTRRHYSTSNAWHLGSGPGGSYPDAANASLYMPALYLDQPADLVFRHWAKMEYDIDQNDDHYWDGGVVELSTNGGASYAHIFPEGGYPHRITDNPDSPFAPDTPCYGETVGWEEAVFDLSAFTGATVNIRFRFGSDFYVVDEGWYIDDIQIRYRDHASWFWIATETGGVVAASQTTNASVTLDTTGLVLGEQRDAILVLRGNDPELNAPLLVPVGLHNATREIVVTHSANGTVSPSGVVWVVQGEDQSWSLQGDPLYMIDAAYTNGAMISGAGATTALYFTWFNIQSNGTLHVDFTENIVLGLVPEWWLAANGLTNPPPEQEAVTDHDGDGMLSWQEYVAGTEPTNAGSVALMLHDADEMPEGNVFRWISYTNANVTYDLEASTNLAAGFHALVTNIQATPPVNSYTNSSTNLFEILRVRAIWPD